VLLLLGPCRRGAAGGTSTSCTRSNGWPSDELEPAASSPLSGPGPVQQTA
jgi:hypothetical protein